MTAHLLDVNVLLALADPMHVHHEAAHAWFERHAAAGWATCPITENAFVRIASHPEYPNRPGEAPVVIELLRRTCAHVGHRSGRTPSACGRSWSRITRSRTAS